MVVTFCVHAQFDGTDEYRVKILSILNEIVKDSPVDMYLGGYGEFDSFVYDCCVKYKQMHSDVSIYYITPYMNDEYIKRQTYLQKEYDGVIYPEIEGVPPRLAITYRNKWMVDSADVVIAYIEHDWGGAYKTYLYAKKKGKIIFNIGTFGA